MKLYFLKKFSWNRMMILGIVAGSLFFTSWFFYPIRIRSQSEQSIQTQEPWMTVFVHGTFGSMLGFLSFFNVLEDKTEGTLYRELTNKMRDDEFFYKDNIMMPRGLTRIHPTWDNKKIGKQYAAYPILQAYADVQEAVAPGQRINYFYTFGWSGLLSQNNRLFEAIRFFNALCEERDRLIKEGINPKICIICHSHGGNVALNLGAILLALGLNWSDDTAVDKLALPEPVKENIKKLIKFLKDLPNKEIAKTKTGQEVYDYVPTQKQLEIDELILLGTPIQQETAPFAFTSFKKTINVYSSADLVQRADWVSSQQPISQQRLAVDLFGSKQKDAPNSTVKQVRLSMELPVINGMLSFPDQENGQALAAKHETSIFEDWLSGKNVFTQETKDPTHKDLWYAGWEDQPKTFLHPLPAVVLVPLLRKLLDETKDLTDCDATFNVEGQTITAAIADFGAIKKEVKHTVQLNRSVIDEARKKLEMWRPPVATPQTHFEKSYKHLNGD